MEQVYQSAFLKALGWSLLDSLWQMGLLWLLFVLLTANGKKFGAAQRHSLALLSLGGGSLWFVVNLVVHFYRAAAAPQIIMLSDAEGMAAPSLLAQWASFIEPLLPFLSLIYLFITALLLIRLYRQYHVTNRLLHTGRSKADPELRVFLQQAAAHLGIKKKVTLWLSAVADTPLTIGFWKPVILLPVAAINHLSIPQTEAILLHELQHIRRNDYLVNLLIACTEVVLFFNPFARLLTAAIRREREHSCDDLVLQFRYDAAQYAQSLLVLEQSRSKAVPALAIAATGKNQQLLLNRIKRILYKEKVTTALSQKVIAYFLSALLIGLIGWYNPGNVIVQTIRPETEPMVATPEFAGNFTTPAGPEQAPANEKVKASASTGQRPRQVSAAQPATGSLAQQPARRLLEQEYLRSAVELQELTNRINGMLTVMTLQQQAASAFSENIARFVSEGQTIEFSLQVQQDQTAAASNNSSAEIRPFVPSSSFTYQFMEDTTLPKQPIETMADRQAREAMEKSLKGLQAINWSRLQQQLAAAGQRVDIRQLQSARQGLNAQQDAWRIKLQSFQQERVKKQAEMEQLRQEIIMDRLNEGNKKIEGKGKKVVDI